ncbi:MAG: ABC transporter ATP-binding protein [Thermotogaceae bacterium]|nr:ABC transporter ATP-binding protein [Thermotogaceae bacterium]
MPTIRVVNLKKYFGKVKAVDNISFEVKDGEFVALLGPSGCGKTTTLLMLAGIYKPTGGEIWFDDQLMNNVPPKYREIGMVFQNYALYPHMTVYENIAFPLRAKKMEENEIKKRVHDVAKKLMIENLLDRKPGQISGGQQQRVALARALIKQPKVLLFDEPLSNLDAKLRMMMRAEIKKLQEDLGITSVYVTHDQAEAMTMASRIVVFSRGKIMQYGTPDEVYRKPKNIFVATFIGNPAMNLIRNLDYIKEKGKAFLVSENLRLELPEDVAKKIEESKNSGKFILGFRPEDAKIDQKESDMGFWAYVYVLEPLGRDLIINLKVIGTEELIKIFAEDEVNIKKDEKVFVKLQHGKIHIFDSETEELII